MSIYLNTQTRNIQDQKKDGELICPIAYTDVDTFDDTKISHMRMTEDGRLASMAYFEVEALEQWLNRSNNDPFTNRPFKGPIKERLRIIQEARGTTMPENLNDTFRAYCENPTRFKETNPNNYRWMRRHIKTEENSFICPWAEDTSTTFRSRALELLSEKPKGSFVLRPSSIKSTQNFRVVALSYLARPKLRTFYEPADVFEAEIKHVLIGHCYGYGYMIVETTGSTMPDIQSAIPMPKHDITWGSFLDVLEWLSQNNVIDLKKIVN